FLSKLSNRRSDEYGDDRLKLPLEVLRAVRSEVGSDFIVGVRFLGDEAIAGGNTLEDTKPIGIALARNGADYLSISRGGKFEDAKRPRIGEAAYPYTGASGEACMPNHKMAAGANIHLAAEIRATLRNNAYQIPVVGSGKINTAELAESILREG